MTRRLLVAAGLVLALGVPNALVVNKERLLSSGTTMLLELAPVDPRSLIEGDYMRLDYRLARAAWRVVDADSAEAANDGHLVVTVDERGVAELVRLHEPGAPLAPGEHLLRYRRRGDRMRVGTDAYYFQEGLADLFSHARYGEVRVSAGGETVLVGLRDAECRALRAE